MSNIIYRVHDSHAKLGPAVVSGTPPIFEDWSMDIVDIVTGVSLLVLKESNSKWVELELLPDTKGSSIVKALDKVFSRFPTPSIIRSDNGLNLKFGEVETWMKKRNIQCIFTSAYNPSANGGVERANQSIVNQFRGCINREQLLAKLDSIRAVLNKTKHAAHGFAPMDLVFDRLGEKDLEKMEQNVEVYKARQFQQMDRNQQPFPEIKVGDWFTAKVMVVSWDRKVAPRRKSPQKVVAVNDFTISYHGSKGELLKISRRHILKYIQRDLGVFVFNNSKGSLPVAQLEATVPVVPGGSGEEDRKGDAKLVRKPGFGWRQTNGGGGGEGLVVADNVVRQPPPTTIVTIPVPVAHPTTIVNTPNPLAQPTTIVNIPIPLAQPTTVVNPTIPGVQRTTMISVPIPLKYGIMTVQAMQEAHAHVVALATVSGDKVKAVPIMLQKLCGRVSLPSEIAKELNMMRSEYRGHTMPLGIVKDKAQRIAELFGKYV